MKRPAWERALDTSRNSLNEFAERTFDPRRRFTGQMPDFKGIYQEGCYVSPHYRISRFEFSKNTNNQAKKLPDDFPRFSFSKILKIQNNVSKFFQPQVLCNSNQMILWCQVQQFNTEQTPRRHPLTACFEECFSILDHASTTFQLKNQRSYHIQWEKPTLNHQLYHVNLKLSL